MKYYIIVGIIIFFIGFIILINYNKSNAEINTITSNSKYYAGTAPYVAKY